jgi:SWIM zinc finger
MAGEGDLLKLLRAQCARLDGETLEALASKGLVRRARKDFEGGAEVEVTSVSGEAVTLRVADAHVEVRREGITRAACTCPAKETCRHIIIACLWLGRQADESPETGGEPEGGGAVEDVGAVEPVRPFEKLSKLSPDALTKAAGRKVVRAAFELLACEPDCAVEEQPHLLAVTFPNVGQTVRFLKGEGVGGGICSCRSTDVCAHRVAAALAYRRARGEDVDAFKVVERGRPALFETGETPRSRAEVVAAARTLLESCVEVGVTHLSPMTRDRFGTLSVSALGVDLPRLSLALRGLGEGVALSLARDARADERAWLLAAARTFALCRALEQAGEGSGIGLTGAHRTRYEEVGTLELTGVGAERWRTLSGYAGLTLLFWEQTTRRWYSWSEARRVGGAGGFDPQARFLQEMPWPGLGSPAQASESRFKLMYARRNYQGRLSGSSQTRAVLLGPAEPPRLDFAQCSFRDWEDLRAYAVPTLACGLEERQPLRDLVVIRPRQWGARFFDEVAQVFNWQVADEGGRQLPLRLPFDKEHERDIKILEGFDRQSPPIEAVLARVAVSNGELTLRPVTLFCAESSALPRLLHLSLETRAVQTSERAAQPAGEPDRTSLDEEFYPEDQPSGWPSAPAPGDALALRIEFLAGELQALAERGVGAGRLDPGRFEAAARDLRSAHLLTLAGSLEALSRAAGRDAAGGVLRALYLLHLCLNAVERSRLTSASVL